MPSQFESFPSEILEQIILHALHSDSLGPPSALIHYLSISKSIHNKLAFNPAFYHHLFLQSFDLTAPYRRFGTLYINSHSIFAELKLRFILLKRIKSFLSFPYPSDSLLQLDLWKLVLILYENDGLNHSQLFLYANLPRFINLWASYYLSDSYSNYPTENTSLSLGLYLLWRVQSPLTVGSHVLSNNYSLMQSLAPYNIAAFKYASAFAPDIHYNFPINASQTSLPDSLLTPFHSYPVYRTAVNYRSSESQNPPIATSSQSVPHFGLNLRLVPPLASHSSLLMFFTYHEFRGLQPNQQTPSTRAERDQIGIQQPSREDLEAHNKYAATRFIPSTPPDGFSNQSEQFDQDFQRLLWCGNPFDEPFTAQVYKLGSMTGLYGGRILYPDVLGYQELIARFDLPDDFNHFFLSTSPINVRFQEWYCPTYSIPLDAPIDQPGEGLKTAWLPKADWRFQGDRIELTVGDTVYTYLKYFSREFMDHDEETCDYCEPLDPDPEEMVMEYNHPGAFLPPNNECNGYTDVIITGETDSEHAKAWGNYRFFGRVRRYDGLIVLYRERIDSTTELGTWVFRGYLSSNQNFIGRVRDGASDPRLPGVIEGSFTLNKRLDCS